MLYCKLLPFVDVVLFPTNFTFEALSGDGGNVCSSTVQPKTLGQSEKAKTVLAGGENLFQQKWKFQRHFD